MNGLMIRKGYEEDNVRPFKEDGYTLNDVMNSLNSAIKNIICYKENTSKFSLLKTKIGIVNEVLIPGFAHAYFFVKKHLLETGQKKSFPTSLVTYIKEQADNLFKGEYKQIIKNLAEKYDDRSRHVAGIACEIGEEYIPKGNIEDDVTSIFNVILANIREHEDEVNKSLFEEELEKTIDSNVTDYNKNTYAIQWTNNLIDKCEKEVSNFIGLVDVDYYKNRIQEVKKGIYNEVKERGIKSWLCKKSKNYSKMNQMAELLSPLSEDDFLRSLKSRIGYGTLDKFSEALRKLSGDFNESYGDIFNN